MSVEITSSGQSPELKIIPVLCQSKKDDVYTTRKGNKSKSDAPQVVVPVVTFVARDGASTFVGNEPDGIAVFSLQDPDS